MKNINTTNDTTRRALVKTAVWTAPVVAAVALPRHAQATAVVTTSTTSAPIAPEEGCIYEPARYCTVDQILLYSYDIEIFADGTAKITLEQDAGTDGSENENFNILQLPANEPGVVITDWVYFTTGRKFEFTVPCGPAADTLEVDFTVAGFSGEYDSEDTFTQILQPC